MRAAREAKYPEHTLKWFATEKVGGNYSRLSAAEMAARHKRLCRRELVEKYAEALALDDDPITLPWTKVERVARAIEQDRRGPVESELTWDKEPEGLRLDRDSLITLWEKADAACRERALNGDPPEALPARGMNPRTSAETAGGGRGEPPAGVVGGAPPGRPVPASDGAGGTPGAPAPSMPPPSYADSSGGNGAAAGGLPRHPTIPDQDNGTHPHEEDRTAAPEQASGVPPGERLTPPTEADGELSVPDGESLDEDPVAEDPDPLALADGTTQPPTSSVPAESPRDSSSTTETAPPPSPRPPPPLSPGRRKRRWVVPVGLPVVLVIAVLVVALVNLAGDSDGQPPPTTPPTANAPQKAEIRPGALAIARDGSVYIAEPATHQVRVVRPDGTVLPFANASGKAGIGGERVPAQEAGLDTPSGVAVGSDGTVYIADTGNRRVRRVKDAIVETVPGTGGISEPFGLTVGPNNDLYVTDKATHRVLLVRKDGTAVPVAGNGRSGPASLNFPHGIAADAGGLYIADRNNHVVRRVPLTGATSLMTFAGTGRETGVSRDGGRATDAVLSQPVAVAVSGGDVYIVESGTKRIRRVSADGTITSIAIGELTLSSPTGIAVDAKGVIHVADSNRLIQIAGGKATTIATHGPR